MQTQIPLSLPLDPAMGEDDFLVTPCNEEAAARLGAADRSGTLFLLGPPGSGKSHLARAWLERLKARPLDFMRITFDDLKAAPAWLWDDADRTPWIADHEEKAFHLLNSLREMKRGLLVTAASPPTLWPLKLADLRSRLLALPVAQISPPDDALVAGLLLKHLSDRQLKVGEELLHYLIPRLPRDGARILEAVQRLDRASLADRRALTVPFAREVLQGMLAGES